MYVCIRGLKSMKEGSEEERIIPDIRWLSMPTTPNPRSAPTHSYDTHASVYDQT